MWQDFRFAVRQLRKSPVFALVAVLTLALGIGANVAVFSVTNAVLLNPSGIPHPSGLVALRARYNAMPDLSNIAISPPDFNDAATGRQISSAAVMQAATFNFAPENTAPTRLHGDKVSSDFFNVFQVRPLLGRNFTPEEDQAGSAHVAILSYRAWQRTFGADPNIIGRSVILNQQPHKVIGVMGPDFNWPNDVEVWVPLALPRAQYQDPKYRYDEFLFGVARLQPSASLQQANAYLQHKAAESIASEGTKSFGQVSRSGACSPCR